jgi:hypothetical protein
MHSLKKSVKPEIVNRYDLWVLRHKIRGAITRIILRPLSALSLDEGLNALNGKNPSAVDWFSRPIKCQILARMRISDFLYFRL